MTRSGSNIAAENKLEFGISYWALSKKERNYAYSFLFLIGFSIAFIFVQAIKFGVIYQFMCGYLLLLNLVSLMHYYRASNSLKPYISGPIYDYIFAMFFLFLLPLMFTYLTLARFVAEDFLTNAVKNNLLWFQKFVSIFGNFHSSPVLSEVHPEILFPVFVLISGSLHFVGASLFMVLPMSKFIMAFYKKHGSPLVWLFALLVATWVGLMLGHDTVKTDVLVRVHELQLTSRQRYKEMKGVLMCWGAIVPLSSFLFLSALVAYVRCLLTQGFLLKGKENG